MFKSFRTQLLASHVGLVLVVVAVVVFQLDRSLTEDLGRQLDQRLEQQAKGAAQWGVGEGRKHPEKIAARLAAITGDDVTIFDGQGAVTADSRATDLATVERGAEVDAALKGQVGRASRARGGEDHHYVAVPAADGWVIRLSAPYSDINATVAATRRRLGFAAAFGFVLALGLGLLAARVASRPLREMTAAAERIAGGDFDVAVAAASPEEFGVLSRSLTSLARQLKARIGELEEERAHVGKLLVIGREFMADASHELRTPVAAIQGYSETLMAGGVDGPTGKQFVETIHHHAVRLGRLVQDMLQLSALEARAADKLVKEPVDLRGVAELVAETLEAPATARRATLTVSGGAEVLAIGDPGAVEQILENLVQNAIKYGREGGAVEVRVERGEGVARVIVADDGEGIAAEHLPRLFDRFYRVDAGRSRDRGGTGLGLAIVKELASVMGGTVAVESEVGKGTTFTVELPVA